MPLILDIIDGVLRDTLRSRGASSVVLDDGMDFAAFRQYLEWNYAQPVDADKQPRAWGAGSVGAPDANGFRLRSFGANYHEVDLSSGPVRVTLRKKEDLPRWAFAVLYRYPCATGSGGQCFFQANTRSRDTTSESPWRDDPEAEFVLSPRRPPGGGGFFASRAVVIVTALDGIYDPWSATTYDNSWGHYDMSTRSTGVLYRGRRPPTGR